MEHAGRKHALLSASGASRWLHCTPSARLEEKFAQSASSVYAEEGTLAHEFGDINLRFYLGHIDQKTFNAEVKKLRANKLYTSEMEGEVEKYTSYVKEAFAEAKSRTPDAVLLIEERLDFSHLVENGFGTGDACIIADGVLEVIDLKYGQGIKVDATANPQLLLYGIGALRVFDLAYQIDKVKLTIVQPRLDSISSWEDFSEEIITWGEEVVKPKAAKAYSGEGEKEAGEWCKWCKVKAMCATLAKRNTDLAKLDFEEPHLLTDKQILGVYSQIPMLVDWAKAVETHMLKEALNGKKWEGLKVVEGKSNRKWADEEKVERELLREGFVKVDFTTTKLKGLTDIEKLVGKKEFPKLLGPHIIKPIGKPTLAPESDKRPAMGLDQAKIDFEEPFEE